MLARYFVLLAIAAASSRIAVAGTIWEFPRAHVVVEYHPSASRPFTLGEIDTALDAGVHAIELDLRYRPADGAVVCSHLKKGLEARPTLAEAIERVLSFQGGAPTVRGDGLQFYLVLDIKDDSPALAAGVVRALRQHTERWSTAAGPGGEPKPITVVISGKHSRLARQFPVRTLDSLCVLEGVDYGNRIENRSESRGTFQWISLKHPAKRERVRALQLGRDDSVRGRFNVRIYGCGSRLEDCFDSQADAVNADQDQLLRARALADSAARPRPPD